VFGRCSAWNQEETIGVILGKAEALVALGRAEEAPVRLEPLLGAQVPDPLVLMAWSLRVVGGERWAVSGGR